MSTRLLRFTDPRYVLVALSFIVPVQPLLQAIPGFQAIYPYRLVEAVILALTALSLSHKADLPPLIKWSFWIGLAGAGLSTAFSSKPAVALDTAILEFLIPFCLLYLFVAYAPDRKFLIRCLALFVTGVLLVSAVQFWLIISANQEFAHEHNISPEWRLFPHAANFLFYKASIATTMPNGLPFGYGNIDNYASLWVMLIPVLAGAACFSKPRVIFISVFGVLLYFGLFAYSRGAILLIFLSFGAIISLVMLGRCSCRMSALAPVLLAIIALAAIHVDPEMAEYYGDGMASFVDEITDAPTPGKPRTATASADSNDAMSLMQPDASSASGSIRGQALEKGLGLAREHWFAGIGYGVYPIFEPKFTAPHNLSVQRLVESGFLGLISFLLFAAYAPLRLVSKNDDIFTVSCLIGVSAFTLKAALFGATFSISSNIVWGFGAALCLAPSMIAPPTPSPVRNYFGMQVSQMKLVRFALSAFVIMAVGLVFVAATIPSCAQSFALIKLIGERWPLTATGCTGK